jgi:adenosylcobinamide kinase/adenosylcobinamide-phosphate guanylyltransferase
MSLLFITGPVRSGKSRFAMLTAKQSERPVTYVATAARNVNDTEWTDRIEKHRLDRPENWTTVETASRSHTAIRDVLVRCDPKSVVLIDSAGTWLDDQLFALPRDATTSRTLEALIGLGQYFIDAVSETQADVIVVSEETGWGVVPEHPSGRVFRDALGFTNQRLARLAYRSYLVVCGYALDLKSALPIGDLG